MGRSVTIVLTAACLAAIAGCNYVPGSGGARDETISTQKVLMDALERYREAEGAHPDVAAGDDSTSELTRILKKHEASRGVLADLSQEAWDGGAVKDGFGKAMRYESAGGLGGTPVLISAGPDSEFGTRDDIRSDRN